MSTYYYLICPACKEYCPAATARGGSLAGNELLPAFIASHMGCRALTAGSEHDDGRRGVEFFAAPGWTQWADANWKTLNAFEVDE